MGIVLIFMVIVIHSSTYLNSLKACHLEDRIFYVFFRIALLDLRTLKGVRILNRDCLFWLIRCFKAGEKNNTRPFCTPGKDRQHRRNLHKFSELLIEFTRQELETVLMMDTAARLEENPLQ